MAMTGDFLEALWTLLPTAHFRAMPDGNPAVWPDGNLWGLGIQIWIPDTDDEAPPPGLFLPIPGGDFWAFVEDVARRGASGMSLLGTPLRLQMAAGPDELAEPSASALLLMGGLSVIGGLDRRSVIRPHTDFLERPLLPWRRYSIIDCLVAGDPGRPDVPAPFMPRPDGGHFWEVVGPGGERPRVFDVAELGPWSPPSGALVVCSSREYVPEALAALGKLRWLSDDGEVVDPKPLGVARPISDLRAWISDRWRDSDLAGAPFVIDAHLSRHNMGWGDPRFGPFVGTTVGWWLVERGNRLRLDHVCHAWHGLDTIHWDGTFGWDTDLPATTYHELEIADLLSQYGSSRRERRDTADTPALWIAEPPANLADAYVLALTDRLTDELVFRFFWDEVAAIGWLVRYETDTDYRWRLNGRTEAGHTPVPGSAAPDWEDAMSMAFHRGATALVDRSLHADYTPAFGRDLAAMCNRLLHHQRLEVCGYVKDVAHAVRSTAEPTAEYSDGDAVFLQDLLYAAMGLDATAVEAALVKRGAYAVEPAAAQAARREIGTETWEALSPEAQSFLGAALLQHVSHSSDRRMDYAGYTIQLCRPLEFEVNRSFAAARDRFAVEELQDDDHSPLARFLRGGRPLTLGESVHYLANKKPEEYDSPSATRFRELLADCGADVLMTGGFLKKLRKFNQLIRNSTAHPEPVTKKDADIGRTLALGDPNDPGLLRMVATISLQPEELGAPVRDPGGLRELNPDHIAVRFSRSEVMSRQAPEDDDASEAEITSLPGQQYVARIGDDLTLFKGSNGVTYLMATAMVDHGILEVITREWLGPTVQKLHRAMSRRVVRWEHKNSTEIFSSQSGDDLTLRLRLNMGKWATVRLDGAQAEDLRNAVSEIVSGRWGNLANDAKDVRSAAADATTLVDQIWDTMASERARQQTGPS